MEETPFQ